MISVGAELRSQRLSAGRRCGAVPDAEPPTPAPLSARDRWALTFTVVGVVAYAALDIVAQSLPPHYSPISQAESDLAVGPYGYVMTINFVLRGLLSLAFLLGLAGATRLTREARVGTALLGIWAVGALILAAFPTNIGAEVTLHGQIHLVVALIAFVGGGFGALLLSLHFRTDPRLRNLATAATGISILAILFMLADFSAARIHRLAPISGLLERLFLGLVLLWMLVTALQLLRAGRLAPSSVPTS